MENETPETSETNGNGNKTRRTSALLAALGLLGVTSAAVGGLIYDVAVNKSSQSLTQIGTLATLGMGGLLALAGASKQKD